MRVVLWDHHAIFSQAFAALLTVRGHQVVAAPTSSAEAEILVSDHVTVPFDAVLMELELPDIAGTEAVQMLRRALPDLPIGILTSSTDVALLTDALEAGADGLALKTESVDEVERMLLRITSPLVVKLRHTAKPEQVWSRGAKALAHSSSKGRIDFQPTARELEVIDLLARGADTTQIAEVMTVRAATVRSHLRHLFVKMGVHSRLELVALAVREGLIEPAPWRADAPASK